MPKPNTNRVLENIDRRLSNVEQILPTLATKEELRAAVATLATKEELRAEGEETRRHFDVVAESLRTDIRLIAEGQVHVTGRTDTFETKTERAGLPLAFCLLP